MRSFFSHVKLEMPAPPNAHTIDIATALAKNGPYTPASTISKAFQSYAKHDANEFSQIRNSIKQTSSMFLFGPPTNTMINFLIKLYHENLVRIAFNINDKSAVKSEDLKLSCMFGLLESTDGKLYCTISEAPAYEHGNFATDEKYFEKRRLMITVLRNAGFNVEFPDETCPGKFDTADMAGLNYREPHKTGNPLRDNETNFPQINALLKKFVLGELGEYGPTGGRKKPLENALSVYAHEIRDEPMTVHWIDSCQYLLNRRDGKPTFRPFKRYKPMGARESYWRADCNNGHLCTEAKLFAYATYNNIPTKSFVAYWIGNNLPNKPCTPESGCHVIESYCYNLGSPQLTQLVDQCVSNVSAKFRSLANFAEVFPYIVRPMAVACPGCFANIRNYLAYMRGETGMVDWNSSNCYYPRKGSVGGKLSRKKSKKRKNLTRRR
jgi:hypothetical protein